MHHIGQLNEQPLHAALKAHYAQPPAQTEILVDGYLVDVVREGELIEIQTGNFSAIKRKLGQLTKSHPVRLVYPIAVEKWILKQPKPGQAEAVRRKSPKRGRPVDLFAELVSFPQLALAPNFTLELALIQAEEVLVPRHPLMSGYGCCALRALQPNTGKKRWRRNGWETVARHPLMSGYGCGAPTALQPKSRLIQVLDTQTFRGPDDFARLLPPDLPETFTTADIASGLGVPLWLAQRAAYCLREMGAIALVGKQGRSHLYARGEGLG
jgi:hypothetical protein